MLFTTILTFAAGVAAAPFDYPLPDGFPNPSPAQLEAISKEAGGPLPNLPLPATLSPDAITSLQLLGTIELFEVAFFSQLLYNITNNVTGFSAPDIAPFDRNLVIKSLTAIQKVTHHSPPPPHTSLTPISKKNSTPSPSTPSSPPQTNPPSSPPAPPPSQSTPTKPPPSSPKPSPT
ncbi:MAG: hypothetical protein Q9182_006288 [Xanthomendoza sp. 2 TL-2023]